MAKKKVTTEALSKAYKEILDKLADKLVKELKLNLSEAKYLVYFYGAIKDANLFKSNYFSNFKYKGTLIDFSNVQMFLRDIETFYDVVMYVLHSEDLFNFFNLTKDSETGEFKLTKKVIADDSEKEEKKIENVFITPFDKYKIAEDENWVTFHMPNYNVASRFKYFFENTWLELDPEEYKIISNSKNKNFFMARHCILSGSSAFSGQKNNDKDLWFITFTKHKPTKYLMDQYTKYYYKNNGELIEFSDFNDFKEKVGNTIMDKLRNQLGEVYLKTNNPSATHYNKGIHDYNNRGSGKAYSEFHVSKTYSYNAIIDGKALPEFDIQGTTLVSYNGSRSYVSVPLGIKTIGVNAFNNVETLTEVLLPPSVQYIEEGAFSNCKKLKIVRTSNNLVAIHPYAFKETPKVYLGVFYKVGSAYEVKKPKMLKVFPEWSLRMPELPESDEPAKEEVQTENSNKTTKIINDKFEIEKPFYTQDSTIKVYNGNIILTANTKIPDVWVIPEGVRGINVSYLHPEDEKLLKEERKEVHLPSTFEFTTNVPAPDIFGFRTVLMSKCNQTVLPGYTILFGSPMKYVELPRVLQSIENNAFANCLSLTELHIPVGVTLIGKYAFRNAAYLDVLHTQDKAKLLKALGSQAAKFDVVEDKSLY